MLGCVSGAALLALAVGQASAAAYPGGGSTFTGGAEGWTVTATCTIPAPLCKASGSYDATAGNPSGSLADKTEIAVGLASLFTAEAVEVSPTFTATESGAGTLSLERQFEDAELVSLTPTLEYTAYLVDQSDGNKQKALTETLPGATAFASKGGPVALVAGHSYTIEVVATTKSSVASVGLAGSATFRLDNVALVGPGGGGGGGNGEGGGNGADGKGVSSARLESLLQSSLIGPAVLKGNRLSVKARCPAKVNATCTLGLTGMLNRHKPATGARKAKVKKAKVKNFVLKVKPAARKKLKGKSKLLFKETAKAGKSHATVYKTLKLIHK
jgi:hypothetical protein